MRDCYFGAMTQAPIALVTALRETSILFAVLIGWIVFREPMGRGKALAAALVVHPSLRTLRLEGNRLRQEGGKALAAALVPR